MPSSSSSNPADLNRSKSWRGRFLLAVLTPLFLLALGEGIARLGASFPPSSFFVEEERPDGVWVHDNPYFGYTIFHPRQSRIPGPNLFPAEKPPDRIRMLVLGESAAMGFPDPEFGLARTLTTLLSQQYPGRSFDVINGSMTEINTHILLEIMREAERYEPDIVVLYGGNNEAIGPYGPVGVFGRFYPARWLIQGDRWLRKHSYLVRSLVDARNRMLPIDRTEWKGLDHFARNAVRHDDPALDRTRQFTRANVRAILDRAAAAGIPVVVAPAAVNLNDWPPLYTFAPEPLAGQINPLIEQARELMKQADWSAALAVWREVLTAAPDHADARYGSAQCHEALGDLDAARAAYELALDYDGYRFRTDDATYRIMQEEASRYPAGQVAFVDARGSFFRAAKEPPLLLEHVHLTVAGMVELSRLLAEPVGRLLPALSAAPALAVTDEALMKKLFFAPDTEEFAWLAVDQFLTMQVFQGQQGYSERLITLKQRKEAAGAAIEHFGENALAGAYAAATGQSSSFDWQVDALYGRYLMRRDLHEQAVEPLARAVTMKPDHAGNAQLLGTAQYHAGRFAEAVATLERAAQLNPFIPETWNMLGLSRFRSGDPTGARVAYNEALRLDSGHVGALNNLGYLDYQTGELVAAEGLFRRALEQEPGMIEARYHLGLALLGLQRLDEAALQLDEVVHQQPGLARAWSARGMVAMRQGDKAAAEKFFIRAVQEDSGLVAASVNLSMLWLSSKQFDKAERFLSDALAGNPQAAELHYLYGRAQVGAGKSDESLPAFRQAIALQPERAEWVLEAARVMLDQRKDQPGLLNEAESLVVQLGRGGGPAQAEASALLAEIQRLRSAYPGAPAR